MKEVRLTRLLRILVVASFVLMDGSLNESAANDKRKRSDVPMTRPEECLAVHDGIGAKASFVELSDGSILIARGQGRFSTSKDGGLTWSEPVVFRDVAGQALEGASANLVRLSGNGIGYSARLAPAGEDYDPVKNRIEGFQYLRFWRSEDGGKAWQKPVRISPPLPYIVQALNDTILRTSSGRIILPVYAAIGSSGFERLPGIRYLGGLRDNQWISTGAHHTDPRFMWSYVYYSDDDGRTWKSSRTRELFIWDPETRFHSITNEPTIVEVEPGKLLMYMRADAIPRLYKSWSFDNGETWSAPSPTPLASGSSPAQLRRIPGTGDLLVVWNQHSEEEIRKGFIRSRLSSAVSRTKGAIWEFYQNVESSFQGTRVEPGPLHSVRPEGLVRGPTEPAPERNSEYIIDLPENYCRCSYPSVFFYRDRVLIGHSNAHYDDDDNYFIPGRLRVLPISWLYGGPQNMKPNKWLMERFTLPGK
ncbi:MAG: glycoside hydrolase [Acidobacteria bacterium]|nr:glycoside hydrolase [Acidobacteriota bacterium]